MGSIVKFVVTDPSLVQHIWLCKKSGYCTGIKLRPNEDSQTFTISLSEVEAVQLGSIYDKKCTLEPKDWDVTYEENGTITVVKLNWKHANDLFPRGDEKEEEGCCRCSLQ
ncbi:hypothetical protein PSACC_01431 [Paramicrosporidium saccamoebae]|uniref:Uncharacterized protein n=1 Tax=Paramicrosporidium saccamoebae TaxID=1246581 RepID=A0A2H9TLY7_9FUNG|nr:hypothetical protein PSACC_01431 [Paramicrosporidium saccamoebae]